MDAYDPMTAPDPAAWLALEEEQRLELVEAWHEEHGVDLPRPGAHAAMHVGVENQIAEGDALPVREKARRLMAQGLDRHEAVHAIAFVLTTHMSDVLAGRIGSSDPNAAYFRALERMTARKWLRSG